jgi:hypothetical protein
MIPPLTALRASWRTIGLNLLITAGLLAPAFALHYTWGIPFGRLTRDPVAVLRGPVHIGYLSQAGIFFWAAAAAACFFAARLLREGAPPSEMRRFLRVAGSLTLMLGLDDMFLLHERVFPALGVPEPVVYAAYIAFVLYFLVRFRALILQTEYVLLGMALTFFAVSVGLDVLDPAGIDPYLWEDGAKLVGIVSWTTYFWRTAAGAVPVAPGPEYAAAARQTAPVLPR